MMTLDTLPSFRFDFKEQEGKTLLVIKSGNGDDETHLGTTIDSVYDLKDKVNILLTAYLNTYT